MSYTAKPIVNKVTPFDAAKENTLTFSWDGNQAYANRLILYNANTLEVIYDKKITSFMHSHTVPANILTNGKKYIAQFQVFDIDDYGSDFSDKQYFVVYKTPLFYFHGIEDGETIKNASYEAQLYYYQEDYESLQSYKFYLYDGTKTLLYESDTMYDESKIKYTYKGLDNHTVYYLRCRGITANGMEIDTGYLKLYTDYKIPSTYGLIYAENDPLHGQIKYHTNIRVIQCGDQNKQYKFINGMIDLRDDYIYYEEGFVIEDDFTLKLRGMYLNQTAELLELRNNQYTIRINSYLLYDGRTVFKLTVPNALCNYILYSDPVAFDAKDMITVFVRRIHDVYQLEIIADYDFEPYNNFWFGQQMPSTGLKEYDCWIDSPNLFTYVVDKDVMVIHTEESEPEKADVDELWFGR